MIQWPVQKWAFRLGRSSSVRAARRAGRRHVAPDPRPRIASIYARDAAGAHAGARTIADLSAGRFVMGLGVSHGSSVNARGHEYAPPHAAMVAYLDAYASATWTGPAIDDPPLDRG